MLKTSCGVFPALAEKRLICRVTVRYKDSPIDSGIKSFVGKLK